MKRQPKQYYDADGNLLIKPYRVCDLANIFDVNPKTFRKWMLQYPEELERRTGKYFSVNQVRFCIEKFGLPGKVITINTQRKNAA